MHDLYSSFKGELGPSDEPEDHHRRTANDVEADRLIAARRTLLLRFLPFVRLEDQNLPPADLLEIVGCRLLDESTAIRKTMYGGVATV